MMENDKCNWTYNNPWGDDDCDYWETECGGLFQITEGTPKDNKMGYCPYCGRLILEESK